MGEGKLLTAAATLIAALVGSLGNLPGQGPVYREHWGFLHLEKRREELLGALLAASPEQRAAALDRLLEPDQGQPFGPAARAMAHLRGVAADAAYLLRSTIGAYVLPEVADPEGANEVCRETSISVFLPFPVPLPGPLSFDVGVEDGAGKTVWSSRIERDTGFNDLRLAQAVAKVPGATLADGTYWVHVRTLIDGKPPTATDPALAWPMHVLRGYQARSEAALARARDLAKAMPEPDRTLLGGLAAQVSRAYAGEAFAVASNAVVELERLELAVQNVADEKSVLAGLTGQVLTQLPGATSGLACVLQLPMASSPRPLVVFAAGTPCYDQTPRRPMAPQTRSPAWTAHEVSAFGRHRNWNLAFVESPGDGRNYAGDLGRALSALRTLLAIGDQPIVLVCDREAAVVVSYHLEALRPQLAGLVLIGAGLQGSVIDSLGSLPVRLGALLRHPSVEAQQRSLDYAAKLHRDSQWQGNLASLPGDAPSWLFALPIYSAEIERFVATVVEH